MKEVKRNMYVSYDADGNPYTVDEHGSRFYLPVEENPDKKLTVFGKIKKWWKSIPQYDRQWLAAVGIWTVDGILIGSAITATKKDREAKKIAEHSAAMGYLMGQSDAFKEIAQTPVQMRGNGFKANLPEVSKEQFKKH